MEEENNEEFELLPFEEYCLKIHLYQPIPLRGHVSTTEEIENYSNRFDCYCIECKKESVFLGTGFLKKKFIGRPHDTQYFRSNRLFHNVCNCQRNPSHSIHVTSLVQKDTLTKIGQYPSMADIATAEIERYRKVLGSRYSEFSRAVGLSAHGVGIGAFVYLRRIFEWLINEAKEKAEKSGLDTSGFEKFRMEEKIDLLQDYLPGFLVENKSIYGILSKGLHKLTEVECLAYFEVVKQGIESILDEKIEEERKTKRKKEVKKAVQDLDQKLGKKKS